MIKSDDKFGMRCRARTRAGKRCAKTVQWLIPIVVSRQSWLDALKTGWPCMVRGMKTPEYVSYGLCRIHGNRSDKDRDQYLYGIGQLGPVKLDEEYESARKIGDEHVKAVFPVNRPDATLLKNPVSEK